ncbi:MAG: hypothetical protein AAF959_23190 [Cyanobacteria bacterium P01_D01_bin.56]
MSGNCSDIWNRERVIVKSNAYRNRYTSTIVRLTHYEIAQILNQKGDR